MARVVSLHISFAFLPAIGLQVRSSDLTCPQVRSNALVLLENIFVIGVRALPHVQRYGTAR